jgi:hypothetical protein
MRILIHTGHDNLKEDTLLTSEGEGAVETARNSKEERFRLPGSSYQELVKIIRAYGSLDKEAGPVEVGNVAVVHFTIVSRNNAFLVAIGVIEGGQKKMATEKGRALARALDHDMPDAIQLNWREIVLANEFLLQLVTAVRIRKGMEPSTLQAHVAYSAGMPKNPGVMAGAGAVVDILTAAGLVKEEGGKLVVTNAERMPDQITSETAASVEGAPARTPSSTTILPGSRIPESGLAVTIQIQVQCTANEIDGLGPKLRTLLREITGAAASQEPKDTQ